MIEEQKLNNLEVLRSPMAKLDEKTCVTLVSFFPVEVSESKPGLIPGFFRIDAAVDGKPQLLYLGECMHYVYLDEDRGHLTVFSPAHKVAESIVEDYKRALLCTSLGVHPALWWEHGILTSDVILSVLADKVQEQLQAQKQWYKALVEDADDGWAKSHQHAMVSDLARLACNDLGLERDWNIIISEEVKPTTIVCPACKSTVFQGAVVCPQCHCVLDAEGYSKLQFAEK